MARRRDPWELRRLIFPLFPSPYFDDDCLFSDVHGNLTFLEAVLVAMKQRRPDMIFCLGNLVGYAHWPNEAVKEVRHWDIPTLARNCDQGTGLFSCNCGCAYKTDTERDLGAQSIAYPNQAVGDEERRYLRLLPKHMRLAWSFKNNCAP